MSEETQSQEPNEETPLPEQAETTETAPAAEPDNLPTVSQTSVPEAPADEQDAPPAEPRILGMPALTFRCMALGFAIGLIIAGAFRIKSTYIPVILCAGAGWLVAREIRRRSQKDDDQHKSGPQ